MSKVIIIKTANNIKAELVIHLLSLSNSYELSIHFSNTSRSRNTDDTLVLLIFCRVILIWSKKLPSYSNANISAKNHRIEMHKKAF